jgi:hypothetical protein
MRASFTFEQLKKYLSNTYIPLVCIIVITLFTTSCSTVPTKQTASTDPAANSLTSKEKSGNPMDRLECRTVEVTGTRFTRKVCEYKETWAAIDKKNKKEAEKFVREIDEQSGIVGEKADPTGRMNTPMSPWGQ